MRLSSWFHSTRTLVFFWILFNHRKFINPEHSFSFPCQLIAFSIPCVLTFAIWVHLESISVPLFTNRVSDGKLQIFIVMLGRGPCLSSLLSLLPITSFPAFSILCGLSWLMQGFIPLHNVLFLRSPRFSWSHLYFLHPLYVTCPDWGITYIICLICDDQLPRVLMCFW